ncbi:MAG: addiction module antitoxin [Deltaproteobacteria bacterium]|nr:addiction module antitoxin [Deltaproteobacteria bacterium]
MKGRRTKGYAASRADKKSVDERLKKPEYAIAYLNTILEKNDSDLLPLGLRDAARAHGFARIADATGLNRENLYKALSKGKSPRIDTLMRIFFALGCKLRLEQLKKRKRRVA